MCCVTPDESKSKALFKRKPLAIQCNICFCLFCPVQVRPEEPLTVLEVVGDQFAQGGDSFCQQRLRKSTFTCYEDCITNMDEKEVGEVSAKVCAMCMSSSCSTTLVPLLMPGQYPSGQPLALFNPSSTSHRHCLDFSWI